MIFLWIINHSDLCFFQTSLLQVILGEMPFHTGSVQLHGKVSYASQEPWLFGGSVRQNIVLDQPFDEVRYAKVIQVCALQRDFSQFPFGDSTLVGERGVEMSGGQKARINIAR